MLWALVWQVGLRGCQWLGEEMTGLPPNVRCEPGFVVTHVRIGPKINGPSGGRQEFALGHLEWGCYQMTLDLALIYNLVTSLFYFYNDEKT